MAADPKAAEAGPVRRAPASCEVGRSAAPDGLMGVQKPSAPAPLSEPTSEKRVLKDKDDLLRRDMILLLRASVRRLHRAHGGASHCLQVAEGAKADGMDALNEFQNLEDLAPIGASDFEQELNCKILPYAHPSRLRAERAQNGQQRDARCKGLLAACVLPPASLLGHQDGSVSTECVPIEPIRRESNADRAGWAFTDTTVPVSISPQPTEKKDADKKKAEKKDETGGPLEKNSSKSSFFIYSHDRRFLIKSLSLPEAINLRTMLPKCAPLPLICIIRKHSPASPDILSICAIIRML